DNLVNEGVCAVIALAQRFHNSIDGAVFFERQSAAERVPEQFCGEVVHEQVFARQQDLLQLIRAVEGGSVGQLALAVDGASGIFGAAGYKYVVVLQAEAERIDLVMASGTDSVLAVQFQALAQRLRNRTLMFLEWWNVGWWSRRWRAEE